MEEFNHREPLSNAWNTAPKISPLVKHWMPDASEVELIEATENFRRYLQVLLRICERLEREGRFPLSEGHRDVGTLGEK